ncbi:sensor histidine kinase [Cellulomonas alba]|uniref:histidine kinase n=1 Tax=Cellulomonas alba TaxID=3053467 RepID=A0ABT7SEU0_9CELL|nr:sensor histidine kinase [Cellulomonas alba]MDM7854054.1 sensor histidine kinase [Cellulomonas alba]
MTAWERLLEWADDHRFAVDAAATAVALLVLVPASALTLGLGFTAGVGHGWLLSTALVAPLAWRRVAPVWSAAAVYAVGLLQVLAGTLVPTLADLAVLVALYSVTVHGPRWAYRVAILGALAGSGLLALRVAGFALYRATDALATAVFLGVLCLGVWSFGLARRARRETIEALVDRAERAEVERDQQHRIATAAERARIAREMHDIVAHSLTVMVAQADGGRYAAEADPGAATRALGTIAETGRAALSDMRRLLGVLRTEPAAGPGSPGTRLGPIASATGPAGQGEPRTGPPGAPQTGGVPLVAAEGASAERAPQPAAGDVAALVEQVRASGLHVSFVQVGEPRHLPPGTGLTVYRIAQEALTNVLKHAGPSPRVTVLLAWRPDAIALDVDDDGRGAAADSDGLGQGLLGMRERAAMFGGTVAAGPRPGGGFRVRARIPTSIAGTLAPTAKDDA